MPEWKILQKENKKNKSPIRSYMLLFIINVFDIPFLSFILH